MELHGFVVSALWVQSNLNLIIIRDWCWWKEMRSRSGIPFMTPFVLHLCRPRQGCLDGSRKALSINLDSSSKITPEIFPCVFVVALWDYKRKSRVLFD